MNKLHLPLLELGNIRADTNLIKRLPIDVARRYHALPISTDGYTITVAMAHPEDMLARDIVTTAIGAPACMVKGNQQEIDQVLSEIWSQTAPLPLKLLLWNPTKENGTKVQAYSRQLAGILQAELSEINTPWLSKNFIDQIVCEAKNTQTDLVIFQAASLPFRKRLLVDFAVSKLIDRLSASILVVSNLRWPLENILFAIRDGTQTDDSAVDWVIRLAHGSQAAVTMLPLVPPTPEMYGPFIRGSITTLLTSSDPFGKKMRAISQRIAAENIHGTLKLRNEPPLEQIRDEVNETDADMLLIAAEPQNPIWRWMVGELVNDLFVWFDRPLLISKPTLN